MSERWPDFFLVGAAKSGTTAVHLHLRQHPQIYMPANKEPGYFAFKGSLPALRGPGDMDLRQGKKVVEQADYLALFANAPTDALVGEASTSYLYMPDVAQRIQRRLPQARIIAILRNPIARAYSAYLQLVRDGRETAADFEQALAAETSRRRDDWDQAWHYRQVGRYAEQWTRYLTTYPPAQCRAWLYDDLVRDPAALLQAIYRFLEVDSTFRPQIGARPNRSGVPHFGGVHQVLVNNQRVRQSLKQLLPWRVRNQGNTVLRRWPLARPTQAPALQAELVDYYREDILRLQDLIGRDLSAWLQVDA